MSPPRDSFNEDKSFSSLDFKRFSISTKVSLITFWNKSWWYQDHKSYFNCESLYQLILNIVLIFLKSLLIFNYILCFFHLIFIYGEQSDNIESFTQFKTTRNYSHSCTLLKILIFKISVSCIKFFVISKVFIIDREINSFIWMKLKNLEWKLLKSFLYIYIWETVLY